MTKHHPAHEVELYRDGAVYTVYVELPEVDPEDLSVRWEDGTLHVSAEPPHVYDDPRTSTTAGSGSRKRSTRTQSPHTSMQACWK